MSNINMRYITPRKGQRYVRIKDIFSLMDSVDNKYKGYEIKDIKIITGDIREILTKVLIAE